MAQDHQEPRQQQASTRPPQASLATMWRGQPLRRVPLFRRRKVQTVRLGGRKPKGRLLGRLVRIFRRMRLRWLKLQYLRMLRRLKEHYRNLLKDMAEAGAAIETFQQRVFMESTFAIPVGVGLSSYPSHFGSDRPRTIFM